MRIIRPMMADSVSSEELDAFWESDNYIAEEKFDGSRYILQINKDKVVLTSRRESVNGGMCEKSENVPHITRVEGIKKYAGTILDGEIIAPDRKFGSVVSVMGSLPARAIEIQQEKGWVKYIAFDILEWNGVDCSILPLIRRKNILETFLKEAKFPYIKQAKMVYKNKKEFYQQIVKEGGEGVMLKNLGVAYLQGERPRYNWIKVKKNFTFDGIVIGAKEGKGKYAGTLGALIVGQYFDGELKEVATVGGMTDEQRKEFWAKIKEGKRWVVEFEAQEKTKDLRYRHPRFVRNRNDKNMKECVW